MSTGPLPPLGLYIHIPWCVRKCPYCDFNSHARDGALPEADYIKALLADLALEQADVAGRSIGSVFIGGGTPSLFSPRRVGGLLQAIDQRVPLAGDCEITLEANPGATEGGAFADWRAAGVNRLSLGVQSFDDRALRALGRIHSAAEARQAVEAARRAGFANLNLDLMFGLPGQTLAQAAVDVREACALEPEHLSYYQLTLEPHTPFAQDPPPLPSDDRCEAMQQAGIEQLAQAGLAAYEISAYARAGHACRHNLNYWRFGDYLGLGAGAHGKLTLGAGRIRRRWRCNHPRAYLEGVGSAAVYQERWLRTDELPLEFMMNALRLRAGFSKTDFSAATGLSWSAVATPVAQAAERGWLLLEDAQVRTSELGARFLNDVLALFLPEETPHA